MSKKILAMFLAIVMVLGTMPVMALLSSATGTAEEPVDLGGYVAAAGFKFCYVGNQLCLPYDFDQSGDQIVVTYDFWDNKEDFTFTVTFSDGDGVITSYETAPVKADTFGGWSEYDIGLYFPVLNFVPVYGETYNVRIDVNDGENYYYVDEDGIEMTIDIPTADDGGEDEESGVSWTMTVATRTLAVTYEYGGTEAIPDYTNVSYTPWAQYLGFVDRIEISNIYRIGNQAFNSTGASTIVMTDDVEELGGDAFAHSKNIQYIKLSKNVTSMAQGVFYDCGTIGQVDCDISSTDFGTQSHPGAYNESLFNAEWINDPEFPTSGSLTDTINWSIDLANGKLSVSGTGAMPDFANSVDRPWQPYAADIVSAEFGNGITVIGKNTLSNCTNLNSVVMADSVVTLKNDCFGYCGTIAYIKLSKNVTEIYQGTVFGSSVTAVECGALKRTVKDQLTTLGNYNDSWWSADWGESAYTVSYDDTTDTLTISGKGDLPKIGSEVAAYKETTKNLVFVNEGGEITTIGGGFDHFTALESVVMPDSVEELGGDCFAYCGTIPYMKLSKNLKKIGQGTVWGTNITTISCYGDWYYIKAQASVSIYNDNYANATWIDTVEYGPKHTFTFDRYGKGMENWGNETQVLICPKIDGAEAAQLLKDVEWTITFTEKGTANSVTVVLKSSSQSGTWIARFTPCCDPSDGRFIPVTGQRYTVTATVDYDGQTYTATAPNDYYLPDVAPITHTFYEITWMNGDVVEYVENVMEGKVPVYNGSLESYMDEDGYTLHVPSAPAGVVAAVADATYTVTWATIDTRAGTLGLWGSGYENWGGGTGGTQTELLLCPKDYTGAAPAMFATDEYKSYTFTLTINGVDYVMPVGSLYSKGTIVRFEPCIAENQFVPVPGTTITISLTITDGDTVVFYTSATQITFASDFEPVVPAPAFDFGDIDGNGGVDISDVTMLLNGLAGGDVVWSGYDPDLDGDDAVTISDVTFLLNVLAGAAEL